MSPLVKDQSELIDLYLNIEQSLIEVLGDIERTGVLIDPKLLDKQSIEFNQTLEEIEKNVFLAAEEEFNLSSPKQLQQILFEKLGLPVLRKTPKGQPSTSESVLQ